jgi:hypothetical protein
LCLPDVVPSKLPTSFLLLKSHTLTISSVPPETKYLPPTFLSLPVSADGNSDAATVLKLLKCAGNEKMGVILILVAEVNSQLIPYSSRSYDPTETTNVDGAGGVGAGVGALAGALGAGLDLGVGLDDLAGNGSKRAFLAGCWWAAAAWAAAWRLADASRAAFGLLLAMSS